MSDMLVKLYDIDYKFENELSSYGITIKKAHIVDKNIILDFVKSNFPEEPESTVNECEYALFNNPITCYIAVKNKEIIGYVCYDATAKGFLGPMGVKEDCRKKGVGRGLLLKALSSKLDAKGIVNLNKYRKKVGNDEIK